ncbi:unnamed protein product [Schistocephalus solidus]|uniref:Uncharacterized protein n=1 Tax=Schistocephalus solidus TaxID=70667 RepID=A0A183T6A3_SCHSO|nr:unnamed protein product [Schistocephalus solidus]
MHVSAFVILLPDNARTQSPLGEFIVHFGATGEVAAQVGEGIHGFQLSAVEIGASCVVGGIGWRLMHDHRFMRVDAQSEYVAGGSEEVPFPLHSLFCHGIECAVVGEAKFVDGGCGYTRVEVHPPLVEESAIHPVDDVDPEAFVMVGVH